MGCALKTHHICTRADIYTSACCGDHACCLPASVARGGGEVVQAGQVGFVLQAETVGHAKQLQSWREGAVVVVFQRKPVHHLRLVGRLAVDRGAGMDGLICACVYTCGCA